MSWYNIPNEKVIGFTGSPIKVQAINNDGDNEYEPIRCLYSGCDFSATTLQDYTKHIHDEHDAQSGKEINLTPKIEDATTVWALYTLITQLNRLDRQDSPNALALVRKTNDGMHSTEVWRRAALAASRSDKDIRVKKEQYDWIHSLLDRQLPLSKEKKEQGELPQTIGMHLFSLNEDNIKQALTILSDRRKSDSLEEVEAAP